MTIQSAFFDVCDKAELAESHYVSLYVEQPFYGGPEEGGWWGHDVELIATYETKTAAEAEAKKAAVEKLAKELSEEARRSFGDYCLRSLEEAEARGLFAEDLPEVDGESRYFVVVEDRPRSAEYHSSRHYE